MQKKIVILIAGIGAFFLLAVASSLLNRNRSAKIDPYMEAAKEIHRVESALKEVDEKWQCQSLTVVTPYTYSNPDANTIIYYCCKTSYFETDPAEVTDLNTLAVSQVIELNTVEKSRECEVNGLDAVLCEKDGRAYLCWTITPEVSCVIEYTPDAVEEEVISKMAARFSCQMKNSFLSPFRPNMT